jgi:DNA-binding transcriptional regulator YhcF (GntR family)
MQFNKDNPIYLQIKEVIYNAILTEEFKNGERIPSIRDMAMSLEVNPNTVTRAYGLLQDEGIIDNQRGIGYFTKEDAIELVKNKKKEEFIQHDVPLFFQTMEKLNLSIESIIPIYDAMNKNRSKT